MTISAHKTEGANRTKTVRFYPFVFTSTDEGGIAAYYNYSADGERNIKLTSPRLNIQQNASLFSNPPLVYPTLYASSLITLTPKGYTKHYFEEGRRVCSKLGGGFLWRVPAEDILKPVEEVKYNYEEQHNQQRQGVHETFGKCIGAWPELIDKYDLLKMLLEYKNDEKNFYYHSDHLGSAAYLTSGGDVTQTLNYLPYGEDWIDVQNNMDPRLGQYRFNGKEKDYESGFHYYGARYYWSEVLTGWLSVDPMMDKYPSISPYAYCAWNPVKLVDPDGRDVYVLTSDGHLRRSEKMTKECEDYKGNDVIYAQSTGEFSKKFKEGYLCDMKCGTQSGKKGSYLILGDNRQYNVDIFKFCAENAETEFSLMEFKMEDGIRTLLTTSHHERTPSSEYVSDEYGSAYAKANVCYLISHIHNHFQTVGASFDQNGNSPDIDFRTMINNIRVCGDEETKKTSVSFGIYKCRGDDKYMTDYERNKIDPITMKKIDK